MCSNDDFKVELIYPAEYIKRCQSTMKKYSRGIALLLKGKAILGEEETEFLVYDMTVLQVYAVEDAMRAFGIEMTHEMGITKDGKSWTYFYADLKKLRKILEENDELV